MIINIITSVLVIAAAIILLYRIYLKVFNRSSIFESVTIFQSESDYNSTNELDGKINDNKVDKKISIRNIAYVILGTLVFRILVYVASAIIMCFYLGDTEGTLLDVFVGEWRKWDANNYIRIATLGYSGYTESGRYTTLVFFPFYSWLIRGVDFFVKYTEVSALIVSNICYIVGCCYLFALISKEYTKDIATKTITYLSVFPFAFFFGSMMPESTFFMLLSMCLYYINKNDWKKPWLKWPIVMLIGICATLTRMQGILLIIPAFVEWLYTEKPMKMIKKKQWEILIKNVFTRMIWIPLMSIGSIIYMYINYVVTGNAFMFLKYQKAIWGQEAQWFGKTIADIAGRVFNLEKEFEVTKISVWLPELIIFFLFLIIIYYGIGRVKDKYVVFLLAYLVMNYLPTWLLSAGRYMTVAIPAFIILAIFSDKHKWFDKWIVGIGMLTFGIYLYGFLTWKQIM